VFPGKRVDQGCSLFVSIGDNPAENPNKTFSSALDAGIFVQDEWKPTPFLTVKPGLRFDTTSSNNQFDVFTPGVGFETQSTDILSYSGFGPRFGVAWDPTHDGKTLLSAYLGQVVESGNLVIPDFAGKSTKFNFFQFFSRNFLLKKQEKTVLRSLILAQELLLVMLNLKIDLWMGFYLLFQNKFLKIHNQY